MKPHPGRQNQPGGAQSARLLSRSQSVAADFSQNFFAEQPWTYAYDFQIVRIDHEWSSNQRTYGRFIRNFRREERYNFAGEMQGVEVTRGATDRFNFNYAVGHTAVLSPSTVFDMKGSWLRFNDDLFPLYTIDPASLGFSSSTAALFGDYQQLPSFSLESGSPTTTGRVARLGRSRAASTADARSRSITSRLPRR